MTPPSTNQSGADRAPESQRPELPQTGFDRPASARRRRLGGILVRKECWTLSRTGKLLFLAVGVGTVLFAMRFAYPFLAITNRTHSESLVVEGWISNYGLNRTVAVFKNGGYQKVFVLGGPALDESGFQNQQTYADRAAAQLNRLGITRDRVQAIPCRTQRMDRTYNAALTLKEWFQDHKIPVSRVDVVTLGPHARRSRLVFQKAFGDEVKVGVISIQDPNYDPLHWWRSSEGVRAVTGEGIAYLYARLLFHPPTSRADDQLNDLPPELR